MTRCTTALLLTLALTSSCGHAPPPPVDWPKVVRAVAELHGLAQRHGQAIVVCLVGEAPDAVLLQAPSGAETENPP
jgi:hypothetical protein